MMMYELIINHLNYHIEKISDITRIENISLFLIGFILTVTCRRNNCKCNFKKKYYKRNLQEFFRHYLNQSYNERPITVISI